MAANKDDIRTDAITGKLSLDNFDEKSYLRRQSRSLEPKFNTLFSDSPELNRADALAIHKIAKNREWSREDSEQYISANNDLITRYGGPSQKAIAKARSHYLKKGFSNSAFSSKRLYSAPMPTQIPQRCSATERLILSRAAWLTTP